VLNVNSSWGNGTAPSYDNFLNSLLQHQVHGFRNGASVTTLFVYGAALIVIVLVLVIVAFVFVIMSEDDKKHDHQH